MNAFPTNLAVVPILVGPLQVLLAMLPAILLGLGSALLALFKPRTFMLALRILWRMKLSVLLALAVIGGTVFGARAVFRHTGSVTNAETATQDWPAYCGGPRRTGAIAASPSPTAGGINWTFDSDAKTFHASPAVVGNRLYVTFAEVGVFSTRGAIYCLDADTGGVVWKSAPVGFRATFSSPAVAGKYLVSGEGLHQVKDGRITCLNVTRGGAVLWSYRTKSHVESTACIAHGRAVIGAGDGVQHEPKGALQGPGRQRWHVNGQHPQPLEEIGAERAGRGSRGEVLGRGGDHADVGCGRRGRSFARERVRVERAQQLGLDIHRCGFDLVEQQRTPGGQFEEAGAGVAEEFALDGAGRQGGQARGHEGPVAAAAVGVDGAGHDFLARAGRAGDEHREVGVRDQGDLLEHLLHARSGADQPRRGVFLGRDPGGIGGPVRERPGDHRRDLFEIERLDEIVEGSGCDGPHRRVEVAKGGHHDHRGPRGE